MRGSAFLKALEASLEEKDNFPQIAGFTVSYNPQAPAGNQIKQVVLNNGRIIRPQETYRFAVTDHVLAGGFGHDYFIDSDYNRNDHRKEQAPSSAVIADSIYGLIQCDLFGIDQRYHRDLIDLIFDLMDP